LIIALVIFMIVRTLNRLYAQPAPATESTKPCPECTLSIPIPAKRCPNCTAVIG
jgi:large conductance mechanosensitive channel